MINLTYFRKMALKVVSETEKELFKYYLKGENVKTNRSKSVYTLGFKDGLAVVTYKPRKSLDKTPLPPVTRSRKDSTDNSKSIKIPKLKKITVTTDPDTKKKFILKDGKRIEIVSQSSSLLQKLLPPEPISKLKTILEGSPYLAAINEPTTLLLEKPQSLAALVNSIEKIQEILVNKAPIKTQVPEITVPPDQQVNSRPSSPPTVVGGSKNVEKVAIIDNQNVKIADNTTVIREMNQFDKGLQTENCLYSQDASTQTENVFSDIGDSPLSDQFVEFILSEGDLEQPTRTKIDPMKPKSKEEIIKLNFFNDLRNALNFDRSGNL